MMLIELSSTLTYCMPGGNGNWREITRLKFMHSHYRGPQRAAQGTAKQPGELRISRMERIWERSGGKTTKDTPVRPWRKKHEREKRSWKSGKWVSFIRGPPKASVGENEQPLFTTEGHRGAQRRVSIWSAVACVLPAVAGLRVVRARGGKSRRMYLEIRKSGKQVGWGGAEVRGRKSEVRKRKIETDRKGVSPIY